MADVKSSEFKHKYWNFQVTKSHILKSQCSSSVRCTDGFTADINKEVTEKSRLCSFCLFERDLKLPQLPEMTFPDNTLTVHHNDANFGIKFNCLDALKLVNNERDTLKVAVAEVWKEHRKDSKYLKDVIKPFDWTFTTTYQGTLLPVPDKESDFREKLQIGETDERINYDKLKQKEKILFYDHIHLYEDELADNGCAIATVRIRVMESSFFILFRFFLRVDNLMVRINDTRIYHQMDTNFIIREYTSRESKVENLPASLLNEPDQLWQHVPVVSERYEKLTFPP